jgi:polyferredoxin
MTKLHRPKGLVRYDSQNGLTGAKRRFFRPRIFIYAALMLAGAGAFTLSAMQLRSANMNIVRMTGAPYFITDSSVRNQYMVRVINKTNATKTYIIDSQAEGQIYTMEGNEDGITVEPMGEEVRPVIISIARENYAGQFPITLSLMSPDGASTIITHEVEFLGPNPQLLEKYSQ